ncbi:MAG: carboxymuconolactone decarboxylase family protein [Acidobacteriota bacterium]|nr:carboxymuconolactone decarboxylase family protein [Acidobacteriota bacterium]
MTPSSAPEARVPLLEREQVPAEVAALYDQLLATRGVVPNMFKALSNVPPLVLGVAQFLVPLMADNALSGWYKELLATRVASLNRCEYCVSAHRHLAAKRGASPEQIANLDSYETGPFSEKEKIGFRFADLLHTSGHEVNESSFESVRMHFSNAEIVELTAVCAAFEFFSRVNSSLRIPVTPLPAGI